MSNDTKTAEERDRSRALLLFSALKSDDSLGIAGHNIDDLAILALCEKYLKAHAAEARREGWHKGLKDAAMIANANYPFSTDDCEDGKMVADHQEAIAKAIEQLGDSDHE